MGKKNNEILDNCENLTVWRFNQIATTGDMFWLIKSYEGEQIESDVNLREIWDSILDEFNILVGNGTVDVIRKKQNYLMSMQAKAYRVALGLKLYFSGALSKENLKECQVKLATDGYVTTDNNQKRLLKQLEGLKNKIKWKTKELKDMLPQATEDKKIDIDEQVFQLEKATESPYPLDSKTLSVKRYAFLIKLARDRAEKVSNNGK